MIRRVCFYSGPGAGKSTLALGVAASLKSRGIETEYCHEYVKQWAFQKTKISGHDQLYIFAKQMRQEDIILRNSKSLVITDSPILMNVAYSIKYGFEDWEALKDMALKFEAEYPALNIFVDRAGLNYSTEGRYESAPEAITMDNKIKAFMQECNISLEPIGFADRDKVVDLILEKLNGCP
jgi:hypothetical protein